MIYSGQSVEIHYQLSLSNGTVVDTTKGKRPFRFRIGAGQVMKSLESSIQQMKVGDVKRFRIPYAQAYGPIRQELITSITRDKFPNNIRLQVGQTFEMDTEKGVVPVRIAQISNSNVLIDGNHPLAGKDLTFDINLLAII